MLFCGNTKIKQRVVAQREKKADQISRKRTEKRENGIVDDNQRILIVIIHIECEGRQL